MRKFKSWVMGELEERELRRQAEENVISVRGSNDVPAFELCVEAEMKRLKGDI